MKKKNLALLSVLVFCQLSTIVPIHADENDESINSETTTESSLQITSESTNNLQETQDSIADSSIETEIPTETTETTEATNDHSDSVTLPTTEVMETNTYAIIPEKNQPIWKTLEELKTDQKTTLENSYIGKVFQVHEEITNENNIYYLLESNDFSFYIEKDSVLFFMKDENFSAKYLTIVSSKMTIFEDLTLNNSFSSKKLLNQSVHVTNKYQSEENKKIYLELSNNDEIVGYVEKSEITNLLTNESEIKEYQKYVQITANKKGFANLEELTNNNSFPTESLQNKTFLAKEIYQNTYLALYDNNNILKGYVNKSDVLESDGQQGNWHTYGKLVTITKNWQTWQNFNWTEKNQKGSILNNTYQAKGIYYHFNGSRYLSLYDKYGKWHGYINENATKTVQNEQGNWHKYGKYVTIKENNYKLWSNFDWKKKNISNKLINQTFEARGIYHHLNGSRYLSLYDKNGKWLGYINENATKLGDSKQGVYNSYGKYITITKNNYKLWQNFGWKQKNTSSNILNQTFQARGIYYHLNGRRYLSLFDNNGTWMGYINANATKIADGKQGIYHSYGKRVTITSNNYPIWRGFSWKTKANGNHKNKTYQAKGI